MASNVTSKPEAIVPVVVIISDSADMVLRVIEYTHPLKANEDGNGKIKAITDFKVEREVLVESSPFFRELLTTNNFAEAGQTLITLKEHKAASIEAILCAMHGKNQSWQLSESGRRVIAQTSKLPVDELWDVAASNQLLMIHFPDLGHWFDHWYKRNGRTTPAEKLLFPCEQFGYAQGFMDATRRLTYEHAFVQEYKNKNYPKRHVEPRVIRKSLHDSFLFSTTNHQIEMIGAARGSLRTLLQKKIWKPLEAILMAECDCRKDTFYDVQLALLRTGGYPVFLQTQKSVNNVCDRFGNFKSYFNQPSTPRCSTCSRDWDAHIEIVVEEVRGNFDGLCLDCMDHTKPVFLDEHEDYWQHLSYNRDGWDLKCRVSHGESTWYHSFMGRADARDKLLKRIRLGRRTY
ncbi:hypothetical protein E4T43_03169 [Aureobasidium subglaciale]|nr:hypothetical protein E4T43_03169 [Aureobasidium subglaciale]